MGFTSYAQWMKDTDLGKSRSSTLQRLDEVLNGFSPEQAAFGALSRIDYLRLSEALYNWKKTEVGPLGKWENSPHNRNQAVDKLQAWVDANDIDALQRDYYIASEADRVAHKAVADAIRDNTRNMFEGRKLTPRNSRALADVNAVRSALNSFKSECGRARIALSGSTQPAANGAVKEFLLAAADDGGEAVFGGTFNEFLTTVTPFVASLKNGAKGILSLGKAAKGLHTKRKLTPGAVSFAPGDPAAAFAAILRIQDRQIAENAATATVNFSAGALQAAFATTDFGLVSGPALNAVKALALLAQKMTLFSIDQNEMLAANRLLAQGPYDLKLFDAHPLLGCYLIANSDTSAVINLAIGDYGREGWKFEVEEMVKHAKPVFEKAKQVIFASRYEIAGMRGMKGQTVNWNEKALKVVPSGKIKGLIQTVASRIDAVST